MRNAPLMFPAIRPRKAAGSGFVAEAFLLTGAAFDQFLGRLLGGLALIVELAADHVLALGLTLGFIHRTGDVDLDRCADLGVQANRHFVDAQGLDRRVQDNLRTLDLAAFGLDGLGDVAAATEPYR